MTAAPPVARGLPFVGNALDMSRDILGFLTARYLELGPVFGMRLLHRRFTVLAGVEANRFVIRDGTRHLRSFEFWTGFNARYGALAAEQRRGGARDPAQDHAAGVLQAIRG